MKVADGVAKRLLAPLAFYEQHEEKRQL